MKLATMLASLLFVLPLRSIAAQTDATPAVQETADVGITVVVAVAEVPFEVVLTDVEYRGSVDGESPSGVFLLAWLTVKNVGTSAQDFPFRDLVIKDAKGRVFAFDPVYSIEVGEDEAGRAYLLRNNVNPGLEIVVPLVFDIPPDATGLVLTTSADNFKLNLGPGFQEIEETAPELSGVIPAGEWGETSNLRIRVKSAEFYESGSIGLAQMSGDLVVTFEVENLTGEMISFPEFTNGDVLGVMGSDGTLFEIDPARTALVRNAFSQPMIGIFAREVGLQTAVFHTGPTAIREFTVIFLEGGDTENPILFALPELE